MACKRRRKRDQEEEEKLLKSQGAVLPPGIAVLPPQRYYRQRYRPDWLSGGLGGISSGTAAVLPPPSGTTARRSGTTAAGRQALQEAPSGTTARRSGTTAADPVQLGWEALVLSPPTPLEVKPINSVTSQICNPVLLVKNVGQQKFSVTLCVLAYVACLSCVCLK